MIEVLLVNDKSENNMGEEIYSCVSKNKASALISGGKVLKSSINPQILFIERDNFEEINSEKFVVVLGRVSGHTNIKALNSAHTVIVSADNKKGLALAKDFCNSQILVCGMSVRDTVTISSNTMENATVSINRSVKGFHSTVSECEISLPKIDDNYSLMVAGTLMMIL